MFEKLNELLVALKEGGSVSATFCSEFVKVLQKCLSTEGLTLAGQLVTCSWAIDIYTQARPKLPNVDEVDNMSRTLFQACARAILNEKFQTLVGVPVLETFIVAVNEASVKLGRDGFAHRFVMLQYLMRHAWDNPTLLAIMLGEPVEHDAAISYVETGEFPELFHLRVQMLMQSGCEDFALNICNWCTQVEKFQHDPYIRGVQLVLLFDRGYLNIMHDECKIIPCCIGKEIVHCLQEDTSHSEACLELAQSFLVKDWLRPNRHCCTKDLLFHWMIARRNVDEDDDDFIFNVGKLLETSSSTWQLMGLVDVMHQLFENEFMQFCVEVCTMSLMTEKHNLDLAIQQEEEEEEIRSYKSSLTFICSVLSSLGSNWCLGLRRLSMLAALSQEPKRDIYDSLVKLYSVSPEDYDAQCVEDEVVKETVEKENDKSGKVDKGKPETNGCKNEVLDIPGVSKVTATTLCRVLNDLKLERLRPELTWSELRMPCFKLVLAEEAIREEQRRKTEALSPGKAGDKGSLTNGVVAGQKGNGTEIFKRKSILDLKAYRQNIKLIDQRKHLQGAQKVVSNIQRNNPATALLQKKVVHTKTKEDMKLRLQALKNANLRIHKETNKPGAGFPYLNQTVPVGKSLTNTVKGSPQLSPSVFSNVNRPSLLGQKPRLTSPMTPGCRPSTALGSAPSTATATKPNLVRNHFLQVQPDGKKTCVLKVNQPQTTMTPRPKILHSLTHAIRGPTAPLAATAVTTAIGAPVTTGNSSVTNTIRQVPAGRPVTTGHRMPCSNRYPAVSNPPSMNPAGATNTLSTSVVSSLHQANSQSKIRMHYPTSVSQSLPGVQQLAAQMTRPRPGLSSTNNLSRNSHSADGCAQPGMQKAVQAPTKPQVVHVGSSQHGAPNQANTATQIEQLKKLKALQQQLQEEQMHEQLQQQLQKEQQQQHQVNLQTQLSQLQQLQQSQLIQQQQQQLQQLQQPHIQLQQSSLSHNTQSSSSSRRVTAKLILPPSSQFTGTLQTQDGKVIRLQQQTTNSQQGAQSPQAVADVHQASQLQNPQTIGISGDVNNILQGIMNNTGSNTQPFAQVVDTSRKFFKTRTLALSHTSLQNMLGAKSPASSAQSYNESASSGTPPSNQQYSSPSVPLPNNQSQLNMEQPVPANVNVRDRNIFSALTPTTSPVAKQLCTGAPDLVSDDLYFNRGARSGASQFDTSRTYQRPGVEAVSGSYVPCHPNQPQVNSDFMFSEQATPVDSVINSGLSFGGPGTVSTHNPILQNTGMTNTPQTTVIHSAQMAPMQTHMLNQGYNLQTGITHDSSLYGSHVASSVPSYGGQGSSTPTSYTPGYMTNQSLQNVGMPLQHEQKSSDIPQDFCKATLLPTDTIDPEPGNSSVGKNPLGETMDKSPSLPGSLAAPADEPEAFNLPPTSEPLEPTTEMGDDGSSENTAMPEPVSVENRVDEGIAVVSETQLLVGDNITIGPEIDFEISTCNEQTVDTAITGSNSDGSPTVKQSEEKNENENIDDATLMKSNSDASATDNQHGENNENTIVMVSNSDESPPLENNENVNEVRMAPSESNESPPENQLGEENDNNDNGIVMASNSIESPPIIHPEEDKDNGMVMASICNESPPEKIQSEEDNENGIVMASISNESPPEIQSEENNDNGITLVSNADVSPPEEQQKENESNDNVIIMNSGESPTVCQSGENNDKDPMDSPIATLTSNNSGSVEKQPVLLSADDIGGSPVVVHLSHYPHPAPGENAHRTESNVMPELDSEFCNATSSPMCGPGEPPPLLDIQGNFVGMGDPAGEKTLTNRDGGLTVGKPATEDKTEEPADDISTQVLSVHESQGAGEMSQHDNEHGQILPHSSPLPPTSKSPITMDQNEIQDNTMALDGQTLVLSESTVAGEDTEVVADCIYDTYVSKPDDDNASTIHANQTGSSEDLTNDASQDNADPSVPLGDVETDFEKSSNHNEVENNIVPVNGNEADVLITNHANPSLVQHERSHLESGEVVNESIGPEETVEEPSAIGESEEIILTTEEQNYGMCNEISEGQIVEGEAVSGETLAVPCPDSSLHNAQYYQLLTDVSGNNTDENIVIFISDLNLSGLTEIVNTGAPGADGADGFQTLVLQQSCNVDNDMVGEESQVSLVQTQEDGSLTEVSQPDANPDATTAELNYEEGKVDSATETDPLIDEEQQPDFSQAQPSPTSADNHSLGNSEDKELPNKSNVGDISSGEALKQCSETESIHDEGPQISSESVSYIAPDVVDERSVLEIENNASQDVKSDRNYSELEDNGVTRPIAEDETDITEDITQGIYETEEQDSASVGLLHPEHTEIEDVQADQTNAEVENDVTQQDAIAEDTAAFDANQDSVDTAVWVVNADKTECHAETEEAIVADNVGESEVQDGETMMNSETVDLNIKPDSTANEKENDNSEYSELGESLACAQITSSAHPKGEDVPQTANYKDFVSLDEARKSQYSKEQYSQEGSKQFSLDQEEQDKNTSLAASTTSGQLMEDQERTSDKSESPDLDVSQREWFSVDSDDEISFHLPNDSTDFIQGIAGDNDIYKCHVQASPQAKDEPEASTPTPSNDTSSKRVKHRTYKKSKAEGRWNEFKMNFSPLRSPNNPTLLKHGNNIDKSKHSNPKNKFKGTTVITVKEAPKPKIPTPPPTPLRKITPPSESSPKSYIVKIIPNKYEVRVSPIQFESSGHQKACSTSEKKSTPSKRKITPPSLTGSVIKTSSSKMESDTVEEVASNITTTGQVDVVSEGTTKPNAEGASPVRKNIKNMEPVRKSRRPSTQRDSTATASLYKSRKNSWDSFSDSSSMGSPKMPELESPERKTNRDLKKRRSSAFFSLESDTKKRRVIREDDASSLDGNNTDDDTAAGILRRLQNSPGFVPEVVERKTRYGFLRHPEREEEKKRRTSGQKGQKGTASSPKKDEQKCRTPAEKKAAVTNTTKSPSCYVKSTTEKRSLTSESPSLTKKSRESVSEKTPKTVRAKAAIKSDKSPTRVKQTSKLIKSTDTKASGSGKLSKSSEIRNKDSRKVPTNSKAKRDESKERKNTKGNKSLKTEEKKRVSTTAKSQKQVRATTGKKEELTSGKYVKPQSDGKKISGERDKGAKGQYTPKRLPEDPNPTLSKPKCDCNKMPSKFKCWNPDCVRNAQVVNGPSQASNIEGKLGLGSAAMGTPHFKDWTLLKNNHSKDTMRQHKRPGIQVEREGVKLPRYDNYDNSAPRIFDLSPVRDPSAVTITFAQIKEKFTLSKQINPSPVKEEVKQSNSVLSSDKQVFNSDGEDSSTVDWTKQKCERPKPIKTYSRTPRNKYKSLNLPENDKDRSMEENI